MADLFKTNLVIVSSPLPADFEGTPQEFFEAMAERFSIQSPVGTNFFVVGDIEPSSNQGPWLKGGTAWWVFDTDAGQYVPLDISDSIEKLFTVSPTEPPPPGADDAQIWLQTATGRVIGWSFWTGSAWRPSGNRIASGPTSGRPAGPADMEQYFDTDINARIQWERGAWRTVDGVPRDVKFVVTPTLEDALTQNPGWVFLGTIDQSFMGATLGVASKDPGATPASSFATDSGITPRAAGDYVGSETHILTSDEIESHSHIVGSLNGLTNDNDVYFYRVDDGEQFLAPSPRPPNSAHIRGQTPPTGTGTGSEVGEFPQFANGTTLVTSKQLSISSGANYTEAAEPHNNMQPTWFLWALVKQ